MKQFNDAFKQEISATYVYYHFNSILTDVFDSDWKIDSYLPTNSSGDFLYTFSYNPNTNKISINNSNSGIKSCELNIKVELV